METIKFNSIEPVHIQLGGKKKPTIVVVRFGAYGDLLFISPIINELAKGFDIQLITNRRGYEVYLEDPRVKGFHLLEPLALPKETCLKETQDFVLSVLDKFPKAKCLDCTGTIEGSLLFIPGTKEFKLPVKARRLLINNRSYFHSVLPRLGNMGISFEALCMKSYNVTSSEDYQISTWAAKHRTDFKVFIAVSGSCLHKHYDKMPDLVMKIHAKYPEARIHLVGGKLEAEISWVKKLSKFDRIINVCGTYHIRQVWALSLASDFTVGPETALLVLAGMYGVPKVTLLSHSSPAQFTSVQQNDMSLQAECDCSPCHKLVKNIEDCDNVIRGIPACVSAFNLETIMSKVDSAYLHFKENLEKTAKYYTEPKCSIISGVTLKLNELIKSAEECQKI